MNRALVFGIIAVIFLTGCVRTGPLVCTSGTEGISASFVNFPENVQQNISTPIVIELENRGAYESKQVFAWLRYGKDFFAVDTDEISVSDFEGRSPWNKCTPQVRRGQFVVDPYELPFATTRFERPLTIDLCYHYSNNLTTNVCVDPLPTDRNALEPNCRASDRRFSGGQGSPLGITEVDSPVFVKASGDTGVVRIGVHLENYGDGTILAFEDENEPTESCTYQDRTHKDYVFFKAFLDNEQLDCAQFDAPGQNVANKSFMRYDPEVVETDSGSRTLKKYFLICESEPMELETELSMTFDVEMHYYYRESRADERTTTIRKI